MKIQRVTYLGVRGVPDLTLDLLDPATDAPHDLIVLTGPPASGKTRALEVLATALEAVAPHGPAIDGQPWIGAGSAAKVVVVLHLDEEERTYAGGDAAGYEAEVTFLPDRVDAAADEGLVAVLERYDHQHRTGKIEYLPSSRRLALEQPWTGLSALEQAALRAGKDPRKYSFVPRLLRALEPGSAPARAFADALASLSPTCRYQQPPAGPGLPRCFTSRSGAAVTAAELSHAEADAVLLAATAVALQLTRSIVLIDRPELHVPPASVPGFVAGLRTLGEDNQLLVASTSPEVQAAPGALVVDLAASAPAA
jgi:hypothetical protein